VQKGSEDIVKIVHVTTTVVQPYFLCHMDYFNNVFISFWALKVVITWQSMGGQKAIHQKCLQRQ